MQDTFETVISTLGNALIAPGLGSAEFFVGVLVACGFVLLAVASLLPRTGSDTLEWWER